MGINRQPVAIVNQEFTDRYWPGQDAVGKRINVYDRWFCSSARNAERP